jgi:hypothetical protein
VLSSPSANQSLCSHHLSSPCNCWQGPSWSWGQLSVLMKTKSFWVQQLLNSSVLSVIHPNLCQISPPLGHLVQFFQTARHHFFWIHTVFLLRPLLL